MRQRTYRINLDTLNELMLAKGWLPADLARKAIISSRTTDSIMAGNGILMCTLKKIAEAFGVPIPKLINQPEPKEDPPAEQSAGRFTIGIKVSFDDETMMKKFLDGLGQLIGARHEMTIEGAIPGGSMTIELNIAATDLWRLIASFKDGELESLSVLDIYIPQEAVFASQIEHKEPPDQSNVKAS